MELLGREILLKKGGAIYNDQGNLTITYVSFTSNEARPNVSIFCLETPLEALV